jgi:hypothetical protein
MRRGVRTPIRMTASDRSSLSGGEGGTVWNRRIAAESVMHLLPNRRLLLNLFSLPWPTRLYADHRENGADTGLAGRDLALMISKIGHRQRTPRRSSCAISPISARVYGGCFTARLRRAAVATRRRIPRSSCMGSCASSILVPSRCHRPAQPVPPSDQ